MNTKDTVSRGGTLLIGRYLLPGDGTVRENWGVAFTKDEDGSNGRAGSEILDVGRAEELKDKYPGFELIEEPQSIVSPGFVNSHMHMYGILSHGITPPVPIDGFETFLHKFWWPLVENRIDHDMVRATTKATALELINSGVTTVFDILEGPNSIPGALEVQAEVLETLGMRGFLSFEACERVGEENGELGLKENLDCFLRYKEHPRISGIMSIHTTFTCPPAFIQKAAEYARSEGIKLHMHINESSYEANWCKKHFDKLPFQLYHDLEFLGPDVIASQCVKLSSEEMDIITETGTNAVHVPLSNCEVGGGFSPVPDLLERGVNVGLGTDGYINNFFEAMRGAFLMHKAHRENPEVMPAKTVYELATVNGNALFYRDGDDVENNGKRIGNLGIGTLAPGYKADIIMIDAHFPTPVNSSNIFDQIILYRNPEHVSKVYIDGVLIKDKGLLLGHDVEEAYKETHRQAERLWAFGV